VFDEDVSGYMQWQSNRKDMAPQRISDNDNLLRGDALGVMDRNEHKTLNSVGCKPQSWSTESLFLTFSTLMQMEKHKID
jgi:hypothetical protein